VPYDFIEDTAATQNITIDQLGYERAMEAQRDKARAGSAFGAAKKSEEFGTAADEALKGAADQFEGYTTTRVTGVPVLALFDDKRQPVDTLASGATGYAALAKTPFYLEAGGQVSDTGRIVSESTGASADVEGLARIRAGLPRAHRVRVTSGALHVRDIVNAEVDATVRDATRRNHTATHLLHAALRQVLGPHVKQAGSLVAPDRLRFDFIHFQALTRDEIDRIERIVNEQIYRNIPLTTDVRSTDEAMASGAMALFGEKYGDKVRVVSVPGFSMELCGGTHVSATGDIGVFVIVAESGVAAGTRRIEALTGAGAVEWVQQQRATLSSVLDALHAPDDQAVAAIERLQSEAKRLARENTKLTTQLAVAGLKLARNATEESPALRGLRHVFDPIVEIGDVKLARKNVGEIHKAALRGLADAMKSEIKSGVVVIASSDDGKAQIVVEVTPDLTNRVKAGQIVKEIAPIVGGGGGGRPDFAEAGGKQPEKIDEMLAASEQVIAKILASTPTA
jgi:alanyl-tRNA synthetase